jgi:hypothetical protein
MTKQQRCIHGASAPPALHTQIINHQRANKVKGLVIRQIPKAMCTVQQDHGQRHIQLLLHVL